MKPNITFFKLKAQDIPLITKWFNEPHVQQFYSLRVWTEKEVAEKFKKQDKTIESFVISFNKKPIGYIQKYPVNHHPWPQQELPDEIAKKAAGVDLFIGEKEFIGKGIGALILDSFLNKHIWPDYLYCIVDPDSKNIASKRLFEKCGFKYNQTLEIENQQGHKTKLELWMKRRANALEKI